MSEYIIANERTNASTLIAPSRKHYNRRSRSQERSPKMHLVANQQQQHNERHYDENSDIYVTTAAYRPPSEIRCILVVL